MKKFIALLTAITVVLTAFTAVIPVSAATSETLVGNWVEYLDQEKSDTYGLTLTSETECVGSKCVRIDYPSTYVWNEETQKNDDVYGKFGYVKLRYEGLTFENGKTYTVKWIHSGDSNTWGNNISADYVLEDGSEKCITIRNLNDAGKWESGSGAPNGNWVSKAESFTWSEETTENGILSFNFRTGAWENATKMYIDNVVLVEEGSNVNMIENGSFETVSTKDFVGNWDLSMDELPTDTLYAELTSEWVADGTKALKVSYPSTYTDGKEVLAKYGWIRIQYSNVKLEKGKTYTLKFGQRGNFNPYMNNFSIYGTKDGAAAEFTLCNFYKDGPTVSQDISVSSWNMLQRPFTWEGDTTENATFSINFRTGDYANTGVAYIDCVNVYDESGNALLENGGFETASEVTLMDNWVRLMDEQPSDTLNARITDENACGGSRSVRIDYPSTYTFNEDGSTADTGYGKYGWVKLQYKNITLEKDKSYTLKWANSGDIDGWTNNISVEANGGQVFFKNQEEGWEFQSGVIHVDNWRQRQATFTYTGETTNNAFLSFNFRTGAWGKPALCYIDNVFLVDDSTGISVISGGTFEEDYGDNVWNFVYSGCENMDSYDMFVDNSTASHDANSLAFYYEYGAGGKITAYSDKIEGLIDGETYELIFYGMGDMQPNNTWFGLTSYDTGLVDANIACLNDQTGELTSLQGVNGYDGRKFTFTYEKRSMADPRVFFELRSGGWEVPAQYNVDNIQLYKKGSTVNLLPEGNFEDKAAQAPYAVTEGEVTDLVVATFGDYSVKTKLSNLTGESIDGMLVVGYYLGEALMGADTVEVNAAINKNGVGEIPLDFSEYEYIDNIRCYIWDGDSLTPLGSSSVIGVTY